MLKCIEKSPKNYRKRKLVIPKKNNQEIWIEEEISMVFTWIKIPKAHSWKYYSIVLSNSGDTGLPCLLIVQGTLLGTPPFPHRLTHALCRWGCLHAVGKAVESSPSCVLLTGTGVTMSSLEGNLIMFQIAPEFLLLGYYSIDIIMKLLY